MQWIVEVAENEITEHRLLKKTFKSYEEFIIFTIIWIRVYKHLYISLKNSEIEHNLDKYIKDYYINPKNQFLGMTINAITRESEVPRSTVKRIIENLISRNLLSRNKNRLIIPTSRVREVMEQYRIYMYESNKDLYKLFNNIEVENKYENFNKI